MTAGAISAILPNYFGDESWLKPRRLKTELDSQKKMVKKRAP
jgi:hypothetical protein